MFSLRIEIRNGESQRKSCKHASVAGFWTKQARLVLKSSLLYQYAVFNLHLSATSSYLHPVARWNFAIERISLHRSACGAIIKVRVYIVRDSPIIMIWQRWHNVNYGLSQPFFWIFSSWLKVIPYRAQIVTPPLISLKILRHYSSVLLSVRDSIFRHFFISYILSFVSL